MRRDRSDAKPREWFWDDYALLAGFAVYLIGWAAGWW